MSEKKNSGEGQYEAARRFQQDEKNSPKEHTKGGKEILGSAEEKTVQPTTAEREGLCHGKGISHKKVSA